MIKAIYFVSRSSVVTLAEFHQHWFEVHGAQHLSSGHKLLGYVQHHTHISAYDIKVKPTHDGASVIWVEDVAALAGAMASPAWQLATNDGKDGAYGGRRLFEPDIPVAVGREVIIVEGATSTYMVKAIWGWRRNEVMAEEDFRRHMIEVHGPLCAQVPGLRRYVQNHGICEAKSEASITPPAISRDGWSELWFDDLTAFVTAMASPEWAQVTADGGGAPARGYPLFEPGSVCCVIGRERVLLQPQSRSDVSGVSRRW
jgi:uncharacterized protein (TIGR02118 family)